MRVVVSQFEGIDTTPVLPLAAGVLVATARADAELGPAQLDELAAALLRGIAGLPGPHVEAGS